MEPKSKTYLIVLRLTVDVSAYPDDYTAENAATYAASAMVHGLHALAEPGAPADTASDVVAYELAP